MFDRLARRYRRWKFMRKVRRRGVGSPSTDEVLQMMSDWMHDVAEGFHREGDHARENDVIAVGRTWAREAIIAYEAQDVDQLKAVCLGAADAVLAILRRAMPPDVRAAIERQLSEDRERAS